MLKRPAESPNSRKYNQYYISRTAYRPDNYQ